jgi:hypothetical protein
MEKKMTYQKTFNHVDVFKLQHEVLQTTLWSKIESENPSNLPMDKIAKESAGLISSIMEQSAGLQQILNLACGKLFAALINTDRNEGFGQHIANGELMTLMERCAVFVMECCAPNMTRVTRYEDGQYKIQFMWDSSRITDSKKIIVNDDDDKQKLKILSHFLMSATMELAGYSEGLKTESREENEGIKFMEQMLNQLNKSKN